ncbi:DUF726 domain-containing protein, partial [Halorubrum tibetense]
GGLTVSRALDGDYGEYTAPATQPVLNVRDRADAGDRPRRAGVWAVDDADSMVLFVHGFATDAEAARDQAYTAELGLQEAGMPGDPPVVAFSWDSDVDWEEAKRTADSLADPLADWLIEWADDGGGPVHVIGYSLGARVTGEALRVLDDRGRHGGLASVSLLGGAIPRESVARDGRYGPAIAALDAPVLNLHSRNDRVLGWVYRASDRVRAVGHGGAAASASLPDGYRDVDVTDLVADHYSYFQPEEGGLGRLVERIQ